MPPGVPGQGARGRLRCRGVPGRVPRQPPPRCRWSSAEGWGLRDGVVATPVKLEEWSRYSGVPHGDTGGASAPMHACHSCTCPAHGCATAAPRPCPSRGPWALCPGTVPLGSVWRGDRYRLLPSSAVCRESAERRVPGGSPDAGPAPRQAAGEPRPERGGAASGVTGSAAGGVAHGVTGGTAA